MALTTANTYVAANVENPGVDVTKEYNLYSGNVENITIGDVSAASYTYTVASLTQARELRPYNLVNIAVTGGHFTVNSVLTIDKNWRQAGDRVQFAFTPSDIPSPRTITIKDDAATPNTLVTLSSTTDAGRSRSTRTFVLGTDGLWITVADVANTSTGTIAGQTLTLSGGSSVTKFLVGTKTYDPASVTGPNVTSTTCTVTGAATGDYALATFSNQTSAWSLTAWVSSSDTVSVGLGLFTGTVDLASGTLNVLVIKAS